MTVYELLERRARDRGDQPFLVGLDRTLSASEILASSDEWGDRFQSAGVQPGDRILLKLPNSPEFLGIWFGLAREGAVMVPINPASTPTEVGWLAEHSGARLLVDPEGMSECAEHQSTVALPEDTAAVLYTSGSTGKPKGCMLSHDYYEIGGRVWVESMELSAADRLLMMLPLFHMNAQVTSVYGALLSGATIVWVERFSLSRFWSQVDSLRPSQAFLIGAIPVLLAREQEGKRPSSLRKVACAGLQDDLRAKCEELFGFQMVEGYGLTEGGVVTMERLGEPHLPGSVGRSVRGKTVEIRDSDGRRSEPAEDGMIWIGGEGLMSGYLGNPEATAEALPEQGWLRTSDVGHIDAEGYLHFTARGGEIVRRSGENISLREVEVVLRSHPAVSEAALIAVPDEIYGVELQAYVVLSGEGTATGEALYNHCASELTPHKVPRSIHLCRDLPRTGMERVSKARLKETGPIEEYERFERPSKRSV